MGESRLSVLPSKLIEMVEFLKFSNLQLSQKSRDGRINSAFNEDEIFDLLEKNFDTIRPKARDWVDFSFVDNEIFYPVNIKVSTTKTADNLNCKLGIYYALTGKIPPFGNGVSWENYFKLLSENIKSNDRDYYFLIINKENYQDIFVTSLKGLQVIVANGNNLPFQAKWDDNRIHEKRSYKASKEFLLSTFKESLKLRADAYFSYEKYFGRK